MRFHRRSDRAPRLRAGEVSCKDVGRVLQHFLDGGVHADDLPRLRAHLEACRVCGLELDTYAALKQALATQGPPIDDSDPGLARLREFGTRLAHGEGVDPW